MSVFSDAELEYLAERGRLGRLATIDERGVPHVVPLGWRYNAELDGIDIGGRDPEEFARTRKFRNVQTNPHVAFVVDDVLPPWQPRSVMVRGTAEAIHTAPPDGSQPTALIRITPAEIISWGLTAMKEHIR